MATQSNPLSSFLTENKEAIQTHRELQKQWALNQLFPFSLEKIETTWNKRAQEIDEGIYQLQPSLIEDSPLKHVYIWDRRIHVDPSTMAQRQESLRKIIKAFVEHENRYSRTPPEPFDREKIAGLLTSASSYQGKQIVWTQVLGARKTQEDFAHEGLIEYKDQQLSFQLLLDGHGGTDVAQLVLEHLPRIIGEQLAQFCPDGLDDLPISNALKMAFVEFNEQYALKDKETPIQGGTTTLFTLRCNDKLYVANAGDSRALIAYEDETYLPLTRDHQVDLENPSPHRRGGVLRDPHGNDDFYLSNLPEEGFSKILNIRRSLGDFRAAPVVSPRPDVLIVDGETLAKGGYLVLHTDGLSDLLNVKQIAQKVALAHKEEATLSEIASYLISTKCRRPDCQDNTTVLVSRIN